MDDRSCHVPSTQATSPFLPVYPPVTEHSLGFLDLEIILRDTRLLHDVVIDGEVRFEPSTDEVVVMQRRERERLFWQTMQNELETFSDPAKRALFVNNYGLKGNWCLPRFLRTVKEILRTLVLKSNYGILNEGLNVNNIMQQYYKGELDVVKMAEWLSNVLKMHCAPLRDEHVDRMADMLKASNREEDVRMLVEGLRELLTLLELMKLDATHHQIRMARPEIVRKIVSLERQFFAGEISSGRMRIDGAKKWYDRAGRDVGDIQRCACKSMYIFFRGLARLVLPSCTELIPHTFHYDHDRLKRIREDCLHIVNMGICLRILQDLETGRSQHSESDRSGALLNFLLALLQTASHTDPAHLWLSAVPSVAAEMSRSLRDNTQELIQSLEARLRGSLCQHDSDIFQKTEKDFHEHLLHQILLETNDAKPCQGHLASSLDRLLNVGLQGRTDNLATQIARIGLLHWDVWGEVAYKGA